MDNKIICRLIQDLVNPLQGGLQYLGQVLDLLRVHQAKGVLVLFRSNPDLKGKFGNIGAKGHKMLVLKDYPFLFLDLLADDVTEDTALPVFKIMEGPV